MLRPARSASKWYHSTRPVLGLQGGGPRNHERGCLATVNENLDAGTAVSRGLAECLGAAPTQCCQHAFDVLAGAEAVDAMVDTAARIGENVEATDLDLVGTAGLRSGAKRAEYRMLGLQGFDSDYLGAATPTAQRDLVIVRGSPTLRSRRRPVKHRAGAPALAVWRLGRTWRARRPCASRLRFAQHSRTLGIAGCIVNESAIATHNDFASMGITSADC